MIKQTLLKDRVLTDKERKNLAILEVIRKNGLISRTDISKLTEFNIVTVSNYINHYIKKGLVVEGDFDESTGGRKPVLVELNPGAAYIVGLGLNMNSMVGVLVDLGTNIIFEIRREKAHENSEDMIQSLVVLCDEIIDKAGIEKEQIVGIGVGVPGIIDERGRTIRWPGALGSKDISVCMSIKDTFEKHFGIPTFTENDANAAVLGEKWLGLDRDVRNMLYMFSGVGVGIYVDGQIYRGASGAAGELGVYSSLMNNQSFVHASAEHIGRWEMDLGMADRARQLLQEGEESLLPGLVDNQLEDIMLDKIVMAAKNRDALSIKVIEEAGHKLGRKLAFLINLLNPEIVVIGGGIEACGATLLDAIKEAVKEWAIEEAANVVKIIPSAFGESVIALGVV
ncbi:MAG: ROK family protein, partial [Candidatus Heimdallarchaeota archaeon]|nr:ROK family protein [Candidatus Heimdallarchaeota archaeon]